jgi:hypothetical protein
MLHEHYRTHEQVRFACPDVRCIHHKPLKLWKGHLPIAMVMPQAFDGQMPLVQGLGSGSKPVQLLSIIGPATEYYPEKRLDVLQWIAIVLMPIARGLALLQFRRKPRWQITLKAIQLIYV